MPGKEIKGRSKRAMYKEVRNRIGFLKDGGMAKDSRSPFMGGGIAYAGGGIAMKKKGKI